MPSKIAVAGIVVCVGVMVGFNVAHRLSLALFVIMPLVCSAFIAAGPIEARWRRRREVRHIADEGRGE
jgi:hypothetical protein